MASTRSNETARHTHGDSRRIEISMATITAPHHSSKPGGTSVDVTFAFCMNGSESLMMFTVKSPVLFLILFVVPLIYADPFERPKDTSGGQLAPGCQLEALASSQPSHADAAGLPFWALSHNASRYLLCTISLTIWR